MESLSGIYGVNDIVALNPPKLSHVVLRVRSLNKSEEFYKSILGLKVTGRIEDKMVFFSSTDSSSHQFALTSVGDTAQGPDPLAVGLYHIAWQVESIQELELFHQRLKENEIPIVGIGNHGSSIGIYFLDPDGNENEMVYEMPIEQWPNGKPLFQGKFPKPINFH